MAATPILKRAEKISVLEIAESHSRSQVDGVIQYLALQGIKASRRSARRGLGSVGDSLAEGAHDSGADMLVMGGYGHSYFREALLGGVTADVLARATVPVFLAH
jgi:nucleotide-binding universal stress UspA family protein